MEAWSNFEDIKEDIGHFAFCVLRSLSGTSAELAECHSPRDQDRSSWARSCTESSPELAGYRASASYFRFAHQCVRWQRPRCRMHSCANSMK